MRSDHIMSEEQVKVFQQRGYNKDLLPKTASQRKMKRFNYFTLWMGSVHNIANYNQIGGLLALGIAPFNLMLAIMVSAFFVALFFIFNGRAGSKYGIPFPLHLRSVYGRLGAKLPSFLRGVVAAIAWYGLNVFYGSVALLIIISKVFPEFATLGGDFTLLGISLPGLIAFIIFWGMNISIGFAGSGVLNKFTAILNPLIYLVFGGMTIWALNVGGGIGNILDYKPVVPQAMKTPSSFALYFIVINSIISVWAAPGVSVSDFTQNAKSTKDQSIGQTLSIMVGYLIFALASVIVIIGGSIDAGIQQFSILSIVESWSSVPLIILASCVFLMTVISTNITGNIVPAGFTLTALFPKFLNYKSGVVIASVVAFGIMPWKMAQDAQGIIHFLNLIGAVLGPIAGVMIAQFYVFDRQAIDLDKLYFAQNSHSTEQVVANEVDDHAFYRTVNVPAYIATILALIMPVLSQFIPALEAIQNYSWLVGALSAFIIYITIKLLLKAYSVHALQPKLAGNKQPTL